MTAQHYHLCPCGACQQIRAAQPKPPAPLAYLPCCGAIVRLERDGNQYVTTNANTHLPGCEQTP